MHNVKEKVSNAAAVAKEHVDIMKAQAEEKAAKAVARTEEEKVIAHELRKAKEAEAKMKMHETKAQNAEETLKAKHSHLLHGHQDPKIGGQGHHHEPVGTVIPTTTTTAPAYPLGGVHPPGHQEHKYL